MPKVTLLVVLTQMCIWIWHCYKLPISIPQPIYMCLYLSSCTEKWIGVSLENVVFSNGPLMNMLIFLHQGNSFHLENSFQNYWILIQSPLLYPLWAITFRNKIPFFSDQIFAKINKLQKNLFLSSKRFRFKFLTRSTILNKVVRCYQYNSQPSLYCKWWKLIIEAE